jgi:hypothetical protein
MNNINKDVSLGIKKAQAEISYFIEQAIKAKKMMPHDIDISLTTKTIQGEGINEII